MFTNQRILGIILILFIFGGGIYFTVSKFKQEINKATASPSPTPSNLEFTLTNTPATNTPAPSTQATQQTSGGQTFPQVTELPYSRNKNVGKFPGILTPESLKNKKVVVSTNKGTIEIEIFTDAPIAASNFLILADRGFYDNLKFHRREDGFVIQGGDPLGDGTGGPGYTFQGEPVNREYEKGIVAMANAGPNTNGSQFFIMLENHTELPKLYTIFGKVISGMDVVSKISVGDVMQKLLIKPLQ